MRVARVEGEQEKVEKAQAIHLIGSPQGFRKPVKANKEGRADILDGFTHKQAERNGTPKSCSGSDGKKTHSSIITRLHCPIAEEKLSPLLCLVFLCVRQDELVLPC